MSAQPVTRTQPTLITAAGEVEIIPDGATLTGSDGVWTLIHGQWIRRDTGMRGRTIVMVNPRCTLQLTVE